MSIIDASNLRVKWQFDLSVLLSKQIVWSVKLYIAHALEGNTLLSLWPLQQSYFLISHSTQVNFQAYPQVHMEEVHQLNQDTVLRSKELLQ